MLSLISKFLPHIAGGIVGILVLAATIFYGLWQDEKAHSAALEANGKLQVAEYREAYSKAVAAAYAEKDAIEKEHEHARQVSAATYASLSGKYRAAVMQRAAQAHPIRAKFPDLRDDPQGPGLHESEATRSSISISTEDALICADNTSYAEGAHNWAVKLEALQEAELPAIY